MRRALFWALWLGLMEPREGKEKIFGTEVKRKLRVWVRMRIFLSVLFVLFNGSHPVCAVGTIHLILPLRKWDLGKMNLSNNHMAHPWQKWEWTLGSLMQAELFITVGSVSFVNVVSQ